MKFKKACISLFVLVPSIARPQVILDTALLNNSEKWRPKISMAIIANQLKKVSLGPIETTSIDKGEKKINKSKEKGFKSENGAWGFINDYHIVKEQDFDITAIYNKKDTILINMKRVTINEGQSTGLFHSKKELPQTGTASVFCEKIIIKNKFDTIKWYVKADAEFVWDEVKMCYVPYTSINSYTKAKILKMISNVGDTISIYPVKGFRNKVYKISLPEGIVFERKGEQIAAYQNAPKYLWLRKDLKGHDKLALGGAVIALLSDYHNEY
ncbi:MAG: hypothetical protein ABIO81_05350 [Ginsengibacter sp.]